MTDPLAMPAGFFMGEMMFAKVWIDSSDFERKANAFHQLPEAMRYVAFRRAMSRMKSMATTRVVRRIAERVRIQQKFVRQATRTRYSETDGSMEILIRSGWIPLYSIGARQTRKGVTVSKRGSYRHAFIASMASGHKGVFINTGEYNYASKRNNAIRELYGPNPANDVATSPAEYEQIMAELMETALVPRLVHELDRLLPD